MPNALSALQAIKQLIGDHDLSVVLESPLLDEFLDEGTVRPVERKLYCYSILDYLPVAVTEQPSAAIVTVMRISTLLQLAGDAGFNAIAIVRVDNWTALFHL